MTNNNIDFLKVIRDYNPLEKTKEATLSEINKTFGKYFVDNNLDKIPIEHLMLLYPFSTLKPQKYYNEEIYKQVLDILCESYQKDSSHTFEILKYFEDSFYYGYDHYTFLCDLINDTNIDGMNRRTKFEFCYLPWYIKTFEGVYFKVIPLVLSAILFLKENRKDLAKINPYLFSWDNVPGNDSNRLQKFLIDDLDMCWVESAKIHKSDDVKTIYVLGDKDSAEIMIDEGNRKATLKSSDGRTLKLTVKKEKGKLNIYINSFSNRDKYNKLNKHGFSDLISSCDFVVRNSIGHQGFNFEDKMFEENKIRFIDRSEPKLLLDQEFIDLFEQLLDDCGAIILACLVFRLQHHNEIEGLVNLMSYSTSEVFKRELVKNAVENVLAQ